MSQTPTSSTQPVVAFPLTSQHGHGWHWDGCLNSQSTENETGQILGSLVRFPAPYTFQVVGKPEGTFVEDMVACIGGAVGRKIREREAEVKERKGAPLT